MFSEYLKLLEILEYIVRKSVYKSFKILYGFKFKKFI